MNQGYGDHRDQEVPKRARSDFVVTGPNLKYVSTSAVATVAPVTVVLLNGMVTGTADGQRIGRMIMVDWVEYCIRGTDGTRMTIVYDKSPNGVLAAASGASGIMLAAESTSLVNRQQHKRFVVLDEYVFNPFPATSSEMISPVRRVAVKLPTIYKAGAGAGTIADIASGAVYLVTCGFTSLSVYSTNLQYQDI